jgi:Tfp pilus assembly protein PilF
MLYRVTGKDAQAEACHRQALELARAADSAPQEARSLAGLGRCAAAIGQTTRAEALLRQAHEMLQRIGAAEAPAVLAELDAFTSQEPQGKP